MYKILLIVNFFLLSLCLGFCIWLKQTAPKIAYVRSAVIVEGFQGVKEVRAAYQRKAVQWQVEADTLSARLNRSVQQYSTESGKLSEVERNKIRVILTSQQTELQQYQVVAQEKA